MPTVQPVTTLNIDDKTLQVADLSQRVQNLVGVYNEWNQKLADAQSQFSLVQAGLNDLSRQIILQIKQDEEEAAKAAAPAEVEGIAPTADGTTTTTASPVVTPTAKE